MQRTRRFLALLLLTAVVLALASCGGGGHAHRQAAQASPQSAMGSVHPAGWGATPNGLFSLPPTLEGVPTGTMYDAVSLSAIPPRPLAVAGYTAGRFITWPSLLRDFPTAHHVSIAIQASLHADCLDVEPGDASPGQAGGWALADIRAGFRMPCVYSDLSEMPAVKASLAAAGLQRSQYFLWLAWYRFIPGLVAGYDAVQWSDRCLSRSLDCDTVSLAFLRIAQPPFVFPKPVAPLPMCFKKRETRSACAAAKARVASDERAAASSKRALRATNSVLTANRCRKPYRRGVCIHKGHDASVFAGRVRYFTGLVRRIEGAN